MKYQGYEVDSEFVIDGNIRWVPCGSGAFIKATKGGKKYFIKRNINVRMPGTDVPEPAKSKMKTAAVWNDTKQKDLKKLMKGLTVAGDNIVIEEENFWDDSNMLVTVTEFISGGVGKDYDFSKLSKEQFIKLASSMAKLLAKLHACGVVHGDLKAANFVFEKTASGIRPYLIDFDCSYPADYVTKLGSNGLPLLVLPDSDGVCKVTTSPGHDSPEIAVYNFNEDGSGIETITTATDIFTLAIVLHKMWCGVMPIVVCDSACSVGEGVYSDLKVMLDKKFDVVIGDKCGMPLAGLLRWMLEKDIKKRATAQQVMDVLADNLDIEDAYLEGTSAVMQFDLRLHNLHVISATLLDKDALKAKGVKQFKPTLDGGAYKYYVKLKDGTSFNVTIEQLIQAGFAKGKTASVCEPWEDHDIDMASPDEIVAKGIISIEQRRHGFRRHYAILQMNGIAYMLSMQGLVDKGLAKFKVYTDVDVDTLWPEDGTECDNSAMRKRGIIKMERITVGGQHKYRLIYSDGKEIEVDKRFMKVMGFVK